MKKIFKPTAKIISYTLEGEKICASAAKISTTPGNSIELFESSVSSESNRKLIQKVLGSGHVSIIEHVVFTIAFTNVSAVVEQYFIESRLASFTVKSRRYVDYSNQGFYLPEELNNKELDKYVGYMEMLFEAYEKLVEIGIPKEDARFILPYSFNSNFYCTLNARELMHIISSIKSGRGKRIRELLILAEQLEMQLSEFCPFILNNSLYRDFDLIERSEIDIERKTSFLDAFSIGKVELLQDSTRPIELLEKAHRIIYGETFLEPESLIKSERPRELEQLSYTFYISNITLSGITHIVRHRMQSIIVPSLTMINGKYQVLPDSVRQNDNARKLYKEVSLKANTIRNSIYQDTALSDLSYYFLLSGTLTDVITTMNARELLHFIQLRACNRAQWEVREIAIKMLFILRESFPLLFNKYGPSCFVKGECPERALSCGKIKEVHERFTV